MFSQTSEFAGPTPHRSTCSTNNRLPVPVELHEIMNELHAELCPSTCACAERALLHQRVGPVVRLRRSLHPRRIFFHPIVLEQHHKTLVKRRRRLGRVQERRHGRRPVGRVALVHTGCGRVPKPLRDPSHRSDFRAVLLFRRRWEDQPDARRLPPERCRRLGLARILPELVVPRPRLISSALRS